MVIIHPLHQFTIATVRDNMVRNARQPSTDGAPKLGIPKALLPALLVAGVVAALVECLACTLAFTAKDFGRLRHDSTVDGGGIVWKGASPLNRILYGHDDVPQGCAASGVRIVANTPTNRYPPVLTAQSWC